MTVIVPALNPVENGSIDDQRLHLYAERGASTWVDAFLLSGSTTRGDLLTRAERGRIIDLWLTHVPAERLISCCWSLEDIAEAKARNVNTMLVMKDFRNSNSALDAFSIMPPGTYIYSHPMYTKTVFDAKLAQMATLRGVLPAGGKIAKIGTLDDIANLRKATGQKFALWDGSSRRIRKSISAGAAGVIATPLSHFPAAFPPPDLDALQISINEVQAALDALPDRNSRSKFLTQAAFTS